MTQTYIVYMRGINLSDISTRYINNEFKGLDKPLNVDKSKIEKKLNPLVVEYTQQLSQSKLETNLGTDKMHICICYLIDEYGRYNPAGDKQYDCMNCLDVVGPNGFGIPIKREEANNKCYYHTIDIFCCFECILYTIKKRQSSMIYSNSEVFLREIYQRWTGNKYDNLEPASDHRLLQVFNGQLTHEQYHKHDKYHTKPGNIIFLPVVECIEKTHK